jgi:cytoskeleton protein RodZ
VEQIRNETDEPMGRVIPLFTEPEPQVLPGGLGEDPAERTPESLAHVARTLRAARRRRKVTLDQAAEETRLPRKALAALEGTGQLADLPDPPYDRYFLREYARYLGMAEDSLLDALAERAPDQPAVPPELLPAVMPPRRWPMRVLLAGSAAVVLTLGLARLLPGPSAPLEQAGIAAPGSVQAPRSQPATAPPSGTGSRGVSAVLRLSSECWIQATADGRVMFREVVPAGRTLRLHAKRNLDLVLGSAGAVALRVNGESVATGALGEVLHLSFRWSNGRVTGG